MPILLETKSNTPFPEWMRWMFGAIGIFLLGDSLRRFLTVKSLSVHALFVPVRRGDRPGVEDLDEQKPGGFPLE